MTEANHLISTACIFMLGLAGQWVAWILGIPSILFLLILGIAVGPVLGWLQPDQLFGDNLFSVVSLAVSIILFEGGLGLKLKALGPARKVVMSLCSIGALTTFILAALFAHFLVGLSASTSLLLGAILLVTGPTVIHPLMEQVKPTSKLSTALHWEGIVTDPFGALIAVLVFETISSGHLSSVPLIAAVGVLETLLVTAAISLTLIAVLIYLMQRDLLPDFLESPVTLGLLFTGIVLSDLVQHEAGLLTATLMGFLLANQDSIPVRRISEFKESLRVLLLSSLFIVLAARLDMHILRQLNFGSIAFVLALIFIIRPAAIFLSTATNKDYSFREKLFLASVCPRGVVAASVSSIFGIQLAEAGNPEAKLFVALVFLVVIVTVAFYSITAKPIANMLGVHQEYKGVLIAGASPWVCSLARVFTRLNVPVVLVDTDKRAVRRARTMGLRALEHSILDQSLAEELNLEKFDFLLALTSSDKTNTLAAIYYQTISSDFSAYKIRLAHVEESKTQSPREKEIRSLFPPEITFEVLADRIRRPSSIHVYNDADNLPSQAVPLFGIDKSGRLAVIRPDSKVDSAGYAQVIGIELKT
jgi:NhaP-type Na+/H+ or K+/H+ antiporter